MRWKMGSRSAGSSRRANREVEILGKSVGLEVALAERGPALEHPLFAQHRIRGDAGQEPAQHVILLDDLVAQAPFAPERVDLGLRNHDGSSWLMRALARIPQRGIRGPDEGAEGSSSEMPVESRLRASVMRVGWGNRNDSRR